MAKRFVQINATDRIVMTSKAATANSAVLEKLHS